MLEGLNSAAAGMAAQQQRMDAVANDLANANTTGYKHQRVGFRDLVYEQAGRSSAQGVRTGAGAARGRRRPRVRAGRAAAHRPPLDVAIQGEGFLRVKLADGREALTRDGGLQVDGNRPARHPAPARSCSRDHRSPRASPRTEVSIGPDGTVLAARPRVGRIDARDRPLPQGLLTSVGDNAFVATAASGAAVAAPRATRLTQGALEASNTDMAEAMVAMIESQRAYQLTSKAIQTADQMMEIANGVKR